MESILVSAKQALDKAKIQLMSRPSSAFFTTLCFSLKHVWDNRFPTAATDGKSIFFNPEAFLALTAGQRVSRLLHETLHPALLHLERVGTRDLNKYNRAADYYINGLLIDQGFERIPTWLYDPKYKGLSTDEIYAILPDHEEMPDDQKDLLEPEGDPQEYQQHIEDILVRASIQSKMQGDKPGTIPGDIQIFLDGLLNPKLPWQRILQKHMKAVAKIDYTFRKPNRRFLPKYYLPSLYSEKLMNIAIAVDTSGSVTNAEFKQFVSEIHTILRMMKPEKITLIQFDKTIKAVTSIRNIPELMQVQFKGRGGTDITPVINWVNENKPQLLLIFTDGEFHFYNAETKVPVVWLINGNPNFETTFGRVIHYTI